jgi:hypothetical protein
MRGVLLNQSKRLDGGDGIKVIRWLLTLKGGAEGT